MDAGDGNCVGNGNTVEDDERDALGSSKYLYQNVVAAMPTERNATHYNMGHKNRGLALIFNHETFHVGGLSRRSGTSVDCECLVSRLDKLGFDVQVHHDLEYADLQAKVYAASNSNHSDNDCFLLAVLSHGELGILYARDAAYKLENLWSRFTADRCPSLAGKPKIFFIQACQGDRLDAGVTMTRTETDGHPSNAYRIPTQADFLIAYSTIPGSWFIQALCAELEENALIHDILTILTFVSRRVAIDYESNTPDKPDMHMQKQIPCITSMLTRLVKFNKKGDDSVLNEIDMQQVKTKEKSPRHSFSGIFAGRRNYQVNY